MTVSIRSYILGLIAAATVFNASPARAEDGEGTIQVKSVAEVDGSRAEITLGDLIAPRGLSVEALETLRQVRLADTPKPGESRSFTALGLEQIFRPHVKALEEASGEKVSLRIPTRVTVVRKSLQIKKEDVERELIAGLEELCGTCEVEVASLSLPAVPTTIGASASWKLRLRSELPKGAFSIPLEVANEDGSKRSYWISGTVAIRRMMPVASRAVSMGERLSPLDFTMQMKDVTFANDAAPSETEIAASVAARQLSAGQIVYRSGLRREQALRAGDAVKVMAGSDAWTLSIDGVAQNGGYLGDLVRVKIPRTQKIISGLLKEKGLVEVQ